MLSLVAKQSYGNLNAKNLSYTILIATIIVFSALHLPQIFEFEETGIANMYRFHLQDCSLIEEPPIRSPAKFLSLCLSTHLGNERLIPFLFSAAIIPVVFLLTRIISKNYYVATIASIAMLGSTTLGFLGPTMAYSPDWAFFMLAGMYFLFRKPIFAAPLLFVGIAAKGLVLLVLPALIYVIYSSNLPKRQKILALTSISVVGVLSLSLWGLGHTWLIQENGFRWNVDQVGYAIYQFYYVLRNEYLLWILIPISFANLGMLTFWYKDKFAKSLLVLSAWYYSLVFLLPVFSMYMMYDYRMIPLIGLSSMGFGMSVQNPLFWKILRKFGVEKNNIS
jgi:hypothetical protein